MTIRAACCGGQYLSSSRKNWLVLCSVGLPIAGFVLFYLNRFGWSDENLLATLRLTARLAFLAYLVVFIARPLRQLIKTPITAWLLRERRTMGLSMAAIHIVHMVLIVYRATHSPEFEYEFPGQLIGSLIYALMLMMVVTSFDGPARAIGPLYWRRLHKTGLYALGVAFLSTLLPETREELFTAERWWFIILASAAIFIRLTAYFATHRRKTERP